MPRVRRMLSETGVYHVMVRGINKENIYNHSADKERYLETLARFKKNNSFKLFAYCLMDNHNHLLLQEENMKIADIIKKINISYVYYFNKKNDRVGHLFQDRYRSEIIDSEKYLLNCVHYIHNNPVKANIVLHPNQFAWSSYHDYVQERSTLVDCDLLLSHFDSRLEIAIEQFKIFSVALNEQNFIDCHDQLSLNELVSEILDKHSISVLDLNLMKSKKHRNEILKEIKVVTKASVRELSQVLNLSKDIIIRA